MKLCKFCVLFFQFLAILSQNRASGEEEASVNGAPQIAALLSFRNGIVSDPQNYLKDWKSSSTLHFCNWVGIQCNNSTQQIQKLDLSDMSLKGTISPSLSNLSALTILDLSRNSFEGSIPMELGFLVNLQQLSLSWNHLTGNIPTELGFLQKLEFLDLGSNKLEGEIPLFCNGSNLSLKYIDFSNNSLSGEIPLRNECPLTDLMCLLLWSNKLEGEVPVALSNSTKLKWLDLGSNKLTGELPSEIVLKMPLLQYLYLPDNEFISHDHNSNLQPFFASLVNSSNLQELQLAGNRLGGEIPSIIGDLHHNLSQLHLDDNRIYGAIPPSISNLRNLTLLNLSSNLLNGTIPPELSRLTNLERFYLSNNSLSGEIPSSLGEIPRLGLLDLSRNNLSGSIPEALANLSQLRKLLLYANNLSGTIPSSLGKCTNLEILDLSSNQISGVLPIEVAGLRSLKLYLNLSSNHLHGPLPLELSKMDMVLAIDLSSNNLSGPIPSQLGSCVALESLNLSDNSFDGPLPVSISQLQYLRTLDVSFNKLSGKVPNEGVFSWLTISSFQGNNGLCGSINGLPKCREKHKRRILSILMSSSAAFVFCMIGISFAAVRTKMRERFAVFNKRDLEEEHEEQETERKERKYPRISYGQLVEATGGFSSSSLIGSGRFGDVYKGTLPDNTKIAVKVLNPLRTAGEISGSFKRECQVLRRTRHRNLMKIITTCSRPDFKALVLPLMSNGSLESHLYPRQGEGPSWCKIDLVQVVSICSDVAEGVAYLHHHSPVRVVHCDLKPSNILLDEDMTALVTDFGIARLVSGGEDNHDNDNNGAASQQDSASFSSTHGLLCGSVGYIAPEYGLGKRASTEGDVFSYGVLLLELITGKRPTDDFFAQGAGLQGWVKSQYPDRLDPIVDDAMDRYCRAAAAAEGGPRPCKRLWREVIVEVIEMGLMCTQFSPAMRPTMVNVAQEMTRLKEYLSHSLSSLYTRR
ncbi:putative leucine-rich repeat receptor-like serine/threonine-protein kinase At2g24130 [Cucurbita pepo subsp. pepo]|uniref:putative leucine-rich repeat receptor-like serine/threonine-protein kinase At2g24130 n=1 Tax=Cucurbita pepo subsp. pepo TaxID=3664 RepID=UPI000C9D40CB|nr:putative leucine-rich repeat receptor-like serine/threonine-protein kinase At2g24130 [Cucurbita pepo subsp. pepo]